MKISLGSKSMNVLVINQENTPRHSQLPQFIRFTFGENWLSRKKSASMMARLPPSMALPGASEALLITTEGVLGYSVSVSTSMKSHEGT